MALCHFTLRLYVFQSPFSFNTNTTQLGSVALFGTVSTYSAALNSRHMYKRRQMKSDSKSGESESAALATPLTDRLFGTWTLLSAIVRFYAAVNLRNQVVYDITMWTFVVVIFHFYTEFIHYNTMDRGRGFVQLIPLSQAPIALGWMLWKRNYYLSAA